MEQIPPLFEDSIWIAALVFMRVSAAMALLPAFGEQVTPMRTKFAATLAFSMIVAPTVWEQINLAYTNFGALNSFNPLVLHPTLPPKFSGATLVSPAGITPSVWATLQPVSLQPPLPLSLFLSCHR